MSDDTCAAQHAQPVVRLTPRRVPFPWSKNSPLIFRSDPDTNIMSDNRKFISTEARGKGIGLVLMGDTHGRHRDIAVPDGDWLIHVGDFTNSSKSQREILDFNAWLGDFPHAYKIVVPGNHEFFLEADPSKQSLLNNAIVLLNEGVQVEGLRIWGSPVTPLYGGAFGMSSAADRKRLYAGIPDNTDILITHGPPYGVLDVMPNSALHTGCRELFEAVMRVRPRVHAFGHVHRCGILYTDSTTFVNAALLGIHGGIEKAPIVLRLSRKGTK